jgi:hypothetical protein
MSRSPRDRRSDRDERHPIPNLVAPVPGAVLSDEDPLPVLLGKRFARVEAHAEGRDMGSELHRRGRRRRARRRRPSSGSETFRPWHVGYPKSIPGRGARSSSSGGTSSAQHVAPVVREPQVLRPGLPVEADGVADSAGERLEARPVRPHSVNRGIHRLGLTDVARRADRTYSSPSGPKAMNFQP